MRPDPRFYRSLHHGTVILAFIASTAFGQTTWFVDDDNCPGPGSGTAGDPFCAIQQGIDASSDGDRVIVFDGIYTGPGNRNITFDGRAIELRSASGPDQCVINAQNITRMFAFIFNETRDSIVDGFTMTLGRSGVGGGAVLCSDASPTIRNCIFDNNDGITGLGGAALNEDGSEALYEDCIFRFNIGGSGGAMANVTSAPTIVGCRFETNTAVIDFGGGMYSATGSSPTVIDCTFVDNRTLGGGPNGGNGGGMYFSASEPVVIGCRMTRNEAEIGGFGRGGGIFSGVGDGVFADCVFEGNSAAFGGGLACIISSPSVVNGSFSGNVARNRAGAIYAASNANVALANCTLTANLSLADAGAVFTTGSAQPDFTSSILWNNAPNEVVGLTTAAYSIVTGGFPGTGNSDESPLFVREPHIGDDGIWGTPDDDYGDLHLTADSPAIDAGDPAVLFDPEELDLDGHARVLCDRVDMGVYEFGLGDGNCDRVVDVFDFDAWIDCYTGPNAGPYAADCEAFDADGDGDVDWADFYQIQTLFD